ncbi:YdbC family protein [Allisonella histaminiformans]|uniref:Transcriptional coactivator p15 (PC4) C-terminal domain-containing protein n=1 Tax=Allisonella histaminiformans TaxID=209880 RepID=A0A1G5VD37_9FIRM|nr:PC4/YdbC family ssDNA-binding protein [Allisonella histaminiformans]PWL45771.1 MAG: hypothetical protein DBY44_05435 [Veillonellaceae bacterium]MCI6003898.1 PC4/YdbC family ssDNA-binding protein [Allisonella histaminiformans]MDD6869868.1 PC4/YdbC family ssDNA-binding protein [Allisonella histaminiformans]MDY3956766.1 PC4/YdbC family ssDNA-binding protein [Allisonella histaminiformans]MDY4540018.1 PC4/YdbC family ssDNA-binding protein [Allisonella histaminiformans]
MAQIQVEIHEEIGNLSESKGWKKQLTYTSWNNHAPKFDIRSWNEDHSSMTKGITLNKEELMKLKEILNTVDFDKYE